MLDTKLNYIHALSITKDALNNANNEDLPKGIIFLTSFGQIQGKIASLKEIDVSSGDSLFEAMEGFKQDEERADLFSLTQAFFNRSIEEAKKELDVENVSSPSSKSNAIPLINVKIKEPNGELIELPGLVLFADQIIGVIPGTFGR